MPHQNIVLNAVQLEFSPPEFSVYTRAFKPDDDLQDLREQHGESWFLRREGDVLVGLPRVGPPQGAKPPPLFEAVEQRTVAEASRFLRALIVDAFPSFLARAPIGRRPFTILSDDPKEDRVSWAAKKASIRHPLLSGFRVMPKLSIDVKLVDLDVGTQVALLLDFADRWEINIPLEVLAKQRVPLSGLHVVRREPEEGERRLVGRIARLQDGVVFLDQAFDETKEVPSNDVYLEGRREAFTRCLATLLGEGPAAKLDAAIKDECDWERTGPRLLERGGRLVCYLRKKGDIPLPGGLSVRVGRQLEMPSDGAQPAALLQTRVQYCFDPSRTKRVPDPWEGLHRWGPFSREHFPKREPTIQVFAPKGGLMRVEQFVKALKEGIAPDDSVFGSGFGEVFHFPRIRFPVVPVDLSKVSASEVAERYKGVMQSELTNPRPDAALVIIDDEFADLPDRCNPYLYAKAALMMAGVPVQVVKMSRVRRPDDSLRYILQNISIALYAKLGGVPWTVDHDPTLNHEIIIGMGTAELSASRFLPNQRFIGVTTVFSGDGNYLLGNLSEECSYAEYPAVLRRKTTEVLRELRRTYAWQPGDRIRVVFHAFKPLKKVEVANIVKDAVVEHGRDLNLEFAFMTVSQEHSFQAFDLNQLGFRQGQRPHKGVDVPERGTIIKLGDHRTLLCTQGPAQLKRPGQPVPRPLLVRLHRSHNLSHTDLLYLTEQVLRFTSLSWKSKLPARLPVTVYYSKLIADLLSRLRSVPGWSPMMLNQQLPTSRWFL